MKKININGKNNTSNKVKPKEGLINLINELNSAIRVYYSSTMEVINNYKKKNNANIIIHNEIIKIEKNLSNFINEAKDLFRRMIIARKQNLLEEEKSKQNKGQLYNYNNFFYYSNGTTNVNTNSNYFTKILNHGRHQKISYKSPTSKTNNISNSKINYQNYTQNSYQKLNMDGNNIISSENRISNKINKNINVPKLIFGKKEDKDKLMNNILILLKQINQFQCKIFYDTKEAQNYKNILNKIFHDLNRLINVLSKEKVDSNIKCLTERKQQKNLKQKNDILSENKKYENILRNIENYKKNYTHLHKKFNKSYTNINSRNPFNQRKYFFSIQNLKSRNESLYEKKMRAKSENSLDKKGNKEISNKQNIKNIRNILFKEGLNDSNTNKKIDLKFFDKEQQTEKIILEQNISKEINLDIKSDPKFKMKELENQNLIKDLENKIKLLDDNIKKLNENISNLKNENNSYKNNIEKKVKTIENLNQELILLKQYLEKQDKKEKIKKEQNQSNKSIEIKNNNIISINEEMETDLDKMSIKYDILKLDYDRQKEDLKEKEKLLNNYNLYTNLNESKISEDKINQLIKKHEEEIEELNQKYTKNILELKINLPNCFSPQTHDILIDKKFKTYTLHWYLLTITSAKQKDYENTFWVSEDEIKSTLNEFKAFKSEDDIEKENINVYILAQQKLINRIEKNEEEITSLKNQILKLKGGK